MVQVASADNASGARLNMLLITADDLNWNSTGCMGSGMSATPHLDEFAATAAVFAHTHGAAPICQPSREAMMTGRVPHRNGGLGFDPINDDVPTLCEILAAAGYYTAGIEKLSHMAPEDKFPWDYRVMLATRDNVPEDPSLVPRNPDSYYTHVSAAIREATRQQRPFFVNANVIDPHRPFHGTDADRRLLGKDVERFRPETVEIPGFLEEIPDVRREVTTYWESVRRFDLAIGNILAALEESGQRERTVVAFISDHGMAFPFAKTTLYESGTRTPLYLRVPGQPQPFIDREHMVSGVDVMPTLAELLDVDAPSGMDGQSLVPLLRGERTSTRDHVITHVTSTSARRHFPSRCIRSRNRAYIFNAWADGREQFRNESMQGLTFEAMKAEAERSTSVRDRVEMFLYRAPEEFYDLTVDPHERHNQVANPAYRDEIETMKGTLAAQMRSTTDPLLEAFERSTA